MKRERHMAILPQLSASEDPHLSMWANVVTLGLMCYRNEIAEQDH